LRVILRLQGSWGIPDGGPCNRKADRNFPVHVRFADEAVCIGARREAARGYPEYSTGDSSAARKGRKITNVDAIHPGYGFLSEKREFRRRFCESVGDHFHRAEA